MGTNVFKIVDGVRIELTVEENDALIAAQAAEKAEYDSNAWLRSRLAEYGSWNDQLDEMFHDFDAWKARIQAVKNKYPKP